MPIKNMVDTSAVTATQQFPIGSEYEEDAGSDGNGPKIWVYVQAKVALAEGNVCVRQTAATTKIVELSEQSAPENRHKVVGIAQHAFTDEYYGWILRRGKGVAIADTGGVTIDHIAIVGNAVDGTVDSVVETTLATNGIGVILSTALATALCDIYVDCCG